MQCQTCQNEARKFGKDRDGNQRYQCLTCGKTFSDRPERLLGDMRISLDRALVVLHHLVEGVSIRSTMRLTGANKNTIISLLELMGERCEKLLAGRITSMPVVDVQCDEIWGFVQMKEKTRQRTRPEQPEIGDAYCFVGIERETKLILAWHLGRREKEDAEEFANKLAVATTGRFQITTDGFKPYRTAIPSAMSGADFAQLVKQYATKADEGRYSPGEVIGTIKTPVNGNPDPKRITTSHVERSNLSIRMQTRRMTRLTNAFSKKWANHAYAMALYFAYYNFCRPHQTLTERRERPTTPAMEAGLEDHAWTLQELVEKSTH
jgi:transposase-like protein/IS1 family transposase